MNVIAVILYDMGQTVTSHSRLEKVQIRALKGLKTSSFAVSFQKIIFRIGTALPWEKYYEKKS